MKIKIVPIYVSAQRFGVLTLKEEERLVVSGRFYYDSLPGCEQRSFKFNGFEM